MLNSCKRALQQLINKNFRRKVMKKKLISLLLAAVMVVSLAACGKKETNDAGNNASTPGSSVADAGDASTPADAGEYQLDKITKIGRAHV